MVVSDEIKVKIVEAGALPHYVKLLDPKRDESEQAEAAKGLWSLAFKCQDSINKEPGCVEGSYFFITTRDRPIHVVICTTNNRIDIIV